MSKSTPHTSSKSCSVRCRGQPKRDASRIGEAHFQRIDRRALCLFGVGSLQLHSGRTPHPRKFSAEEQLLCRVEVEHGGRCVSTCTACAVRLAARSRNDPGYATIVRLTDGIGPLKAAYGMWQEAHASFWKRGNALVEIQQTPPSIRLCLISVWHKYWRIACISRHRRQCLPLCEIATEDGLNFLSNPH